MTLTLAQAATDQATANPQWWPGALVPIGVVVAALIAGYFGGRNSRKTPHEKLAALADIYDTLGRHSTLSNRFDLDTLETAINHEVDNIENLRRAAEAGRFAYIRERFRLASSPDNGALANLLAFISAAMFAVVSTIMLILEFMGKGPQ
ncbi:hypothetical protein [Rhodococcus aetherivorans]|uniref:hypothetical protein n=1 Tax=Rhodococcus aetherivorans TaxID=191292 RepID=UPI0029499866|nr:hypothetical protein [Rhodococcus aetherivorans]MDV6291658.1 hypothetical protein [Rhodococcus aetherivorans]